MVLPRLGDREVLGSFCTEGQGLYPFQHILGKKPTRARRKTKLQPQNRRTAGFTAQKQEADGQKPLGVRLNTHLPVCSRESVQSDTGQRSSSLKTCVLIHSTRGLSYNMWVCREGFLHLTLFLDLANRVPKL